MPLLPPCVTRVRVIFNDQTQPSACARGATAHQMIKLLQTRGEPGRMMHGRISASGHLLQATPVLACCAQALSEQCGSTKSETPRPLPPPPSPRNGKKKACACMHARRSTSTARPMMMEMGVTAGGRGGGRGGSSWRAKQKRRVLHPKSLPNPIHLISGRKIIVKLSYRSNISERQQAHAPQSFRVCPISPPTLLRRVTATGPRATQRGEILLRGGRGLHQQQLGSLLRPIDNRVN